MKALLIAAVSSVLIFSISSCGQCNTCRKYPAADIKICKKDFASEDSYTQAVHQYQHDGYDCE